MYTVTTIKNNAPKEIDKNVTSCNESNNNDEINTETPRKELIKLKLITTNNWGVIPISSNKRIKIYNNDKN